MAAIVILLVEYDTAAVSDAAAADDDDDAIAGTFQNNLLVVVRAPLAVGVGVVRRRDVVGDCKNDAVVVVTNEGSTTTRALQSRIVVDKRSNM